MRGEGKVFVHVDRLACDQAKKYLNSWLQDKVKEAFSDAAENQNWRRHVSAWWLVNTGDQVLVPAK
jgi:hypothetical protein